MPDFCITTSKPTSSKLATIVYIPHKVLKVVLSKKKFVVMDDYSNFSGNTHTREWRKPDLVLLH